MSEYVYGAGEWTALAHGGRAALLVPAGRFADRAGRKRVFLGGLGLFTVASALCGLAPNVERLVQALGHAGELGAPVAETLDKLADDCTTRQFQQVREEAAKLPVKMLFPVLFCIFPPMLMVLAGPAMVSIAAAFG